MSKKNPLVEITFNAIDRINNILHGIGRTYGT